MYNFSDQPFPPTVILDLNFYVSLRKQKTKEIVHFTDWMLILFSNLLKKNLVDKIIKSKNSAMLVPIFCY